jgi:hypothetical protein
MLYWDAYSRHPQSSAAARNGLHVVTASNVESLWVRLRGWFHHLIRRFQTQVPRRGGPLCPPARIALRSHPVNTNNSLHGQAPLPARTAHC